MQRSFRKRFILLFLTSFICAGNLWSKTNTTAADELYQSRLNTLRSAVDFSYHPSVKPFIEEYLANPELVKNILSKSRTYFPAIEKQLKTKGLPIELKYLAATVSLLDPNATNASGATGIWMMAYPVSKMYKIKVSTYVDDRRDVYKSSVVAAQHFKDLFSIYKNWPLAISAYGCSPVMLNKCIRMANNSLYYWDVYPQLPTYCRDLYPKLIATAYIFNFYKEHGIKLKEQEAIVETDSVLVTKWLSFQQISQSIGISIDDLRELNPTFKKDIVPFSTEGYYIRLPKAKAKEFVLLKDSVYKNQNVDIDFQPVEIRKDNTRNIGEVEVKSSDSQIKNAQITGKSVRVIYKIKRGDNLSDIADWFDVDIIEIKQWNKLRSNKINYGQILKIYVPGAKSGYYKRINTMSLAQKRKLANKD